MTNKSNKAYCSNPEVVRICPRTCNACPDQIRSCNDQSIYCPMYRNRCGEAEILNLCAFTCGSCSAPLQTLEYSRATAPPMVETTVELGTTIAPTTFSTMARTTLTKSFPEEVVYQPPKCEDKEKSEFCTFWKSQVFLNLLESLTIFCVNFATRFKSSNLNDSSGFYILVRFKTCF